MSELSDLLEKGRIVVQCGINAGRRTLGDSGKIFFLVPRMTRKLYLPEISISIKSVKINLAKKFKTRNFCLQKDF